MSSTQFTKQSGTAAGAKPLRKGKFPGHPNVPSVLRLLRVVMRHGPKESDSLELRNFRSMQEKQPTAFMKMWREEEAKYEAAVRLAREKWRGVRAEQEKAAGPVEAVKVEPDAGSRRALELVERLLQEWETGPKE